MEDTERQRIADERTRLLDAKAKELDIEPDARRIIELMGDVTLTMIRLYGVIASDSPEGRARGVKKMYRLREALMKAFAFPKDQPGAMFGECIRCSREGLDLSICPHDDIGRLALIALPSLRIYPEVDLDVMSELTDEDDGYEG